MVLEDRYNLSIIRNTSAEAVYRRIEQLLTEQRDFCRCETCVLDLAAFMLNRVSPRYCTSLLGSLHNDAIKDRRLEVEIDLALQAGLKRLREHAHHD